MAGLLRSSVVPFLHFQSAAATQTEFPATGARSFSHFDFAPAIGVCTTIVFTLFKCHGLFCLPGTDCLADQVKERCARTSVFDFPGPKRSLLRGALADSGNCSPRLCARVLGVRSWYRTAAYRRHMCNVLSFLGSYACCSPGGKDVFPRALGAPPRFGPVPRNSRLRTPISQGPSARQ